ncbi:MAG: hypothetical protein LDL13_06250 [Calditerrivibrio sp.]|nr:hypothetical protein [Calditerrivibrio sp.]MCA1980692.1 hypothetical protein [Calditerrivibrio sp.]
MAKKDISFLENEYLHFLMMNFFIGENSMEINGEIFYYQPKNRISFFSEVNSEKVDIESINLVTNKEMYVAFKDTKIIKQIDILLNNKNSSITFSIKSSPLRITGISMPKSIAEEFEDKVLERLLYFECVKAFFRLTFKSFLDMRISTEWNTLLNNFDDYLKKY